MSDNPVKQRRRWQRYQIPKTYRVKARLKVMGGTETHYVSVQNLSMGGASLESQKGISLVIDRGALLEVLFFRESLSLRCVARVANTVRLDVSSTANGEPALRQLGIEIIGIDEKSRKLLADFLQGLESNKPSAIS